MRGKIMRGLEAAADVMLPRTCVVCERRLNIDERYLCLHCMAELPLTYFWGRSRNPMADRFNLLIENGAGPDPADAGRERYAFAAALFFYDGEGDYRRIPQQLKYHGNIGLGRHFGRTLGLRLKSSGHFADVDAVIPVPLHWSRRWKRGYNQAEVIAEEVARTLGATMHTDILCRRRRTATQTRLSPEAKRANVSGAFMADRTKAQAAVFRHILLIDDVFTTGSTLMACFTALRTVFPPGVRISVATLAFVGGG